MPRPVGREMAHCRGQGCDRLAEAGQSRRHKSWDEATKTYLCNSCSKVKPRISVTCRECHTPKNLEIRQLERQTYDKESNTYLCSKCYGRSYGTSRLKAAFRKRYNLESSGDEDLLLEAQRVQVEYAVRVAGGRGALLKAANTARASGLSEKGRFKLWINRDSRKRSGLFAICPWCKKLSWRKSYRAERPGFHSECYIEFRKSPDYRAWLGQLGTVGQQRKLRVALLPCPVPDVGNPPKGTAEYLSWLLQHYALGRSWRKIANRAHYAQSTVRGGVRTILPLLPTSWTGIYKGDSGRRLDAHLPIAELQATIT